ncbi:hypothetical protein [Flavobacterium sp.]|uniref:OB-fold protein n=1 Tax=Flavobacterium sp. TaxID=239 RepID=UPI002627F975|nr:hypothetical protein [Flavobacterium sp.]
MKFKWILILLLFLILVWVGYSYIYKEHRNISTENSMKISSVENIFNEFKQDENKANKRYLDKVIQVKGKVTQVDSIQKTITIDEKLFSSFQKVDFESCKLNSTLVIKGRFIGYDDLLEELKMDNCVIIE